MSRSSQFPLLRQRRSVPFFWIRFLGAMNNNVFKVALSSLVTYHTALFGNADPASAAFLISMIFITSFVLLSVASGQIADHVDKARLIRLVRTLEIAIMAISCTGFALRHVELPYLCTFLMGVRSTLFGFVRHAYLPQHLQSIELADGGGLVEMGTSVTILIGTIGGGELADYIRNDELIGPFFADITCIIATVVGWLTTRDVPASPTSQPDLHINWNLISGTWCNLKLVSNQRAVFLGLLGISWLWFVGVTSLALSFVFACNVLGGDQNVVTPLLAVFLVGISLGSMSYEKLPDRTMEIDLTLFGSISMTVFAVDLCLASHAEALAAHDVLMGISGFLQNHRYWYVLANLSLLAMFGGFYSVSLYALVQSRCEPMRRTRIIVANNILDALFMITSVMLMMVLMRAGFVIPQLSLVTGILNAVVVIYVYALVPEFLIWFVMRLLIYTVYRVKAEGLEQVPDEGPCPLVCNYTSFVDVVVASAFVRRHARFVVNHRILKVPMLSWFFCTVRAIPTAPIHEDLEMPSRTYSAIVAVLAEGKVVCIFPEGKVTATGEMNPLKDGMWHIIERTPVPVVPMALRGLRGSFFSRKGGMAILRLFHRGFLNKLELCIGIPMPAHAVSPEAMQVIALALRDEQF